jgi:hypothetical protein
MAGAALCALTACTGMGSSAGDPLAGTGGRNEIRIVVQNGNFYDARLYALSDGMRRPLGSVGGNADGVFMMPLGSPRDIRLEISLLAGPTCVTYPVPVDPGDTLEVQIRPGPIESDFCR